MKQPQRGIAAAHLVADGVEEVGLAQTDASVEEDGVIGGPWRLGNGLAGRLRELVGGADHEGLEGVAGREIVGRGAGGRSRDDPAVIRKILAHVGVGPSGPSPGPAPPKSGAATP